MAEKVEKLQPRGFRLTDETMEKFKVIAQELGENQQQTMAKLIEVYEIEKGKKAFPEMREQIDTFDSYMRAATDMFVQLLESNHTMRSQVRTEFHAQLDSKDQSIIELQAQVKETEEWKKESKRREVNYESQIKACRDEIKTLQSDLEKEQKNAEKREIEYKRTEASLLSDSKKLQSAELELRSVLSTYMKSNETLKKENDGLRDQVKQMDAHIFQLGRESEGRRVEIENLKALLEKSKTEQENILQQKDVECQAVIQKKESEYQFALQKKEMEVKDYFYEREQKMRDELDRYKEFYYRNNGAVIVEAEKIEE